jgi:anti-sigma regulatory factor (Ser/Thr protein kinase)
MSDWFRDVATGVGVDPDIAWKAEMCLNEAATNIILYGFDDSARHPVTIELEATPRSVRITLVDDGRPFNPLDAAPPPEVHSLEEAPIGGLGIHVIRSFAQNVRYHRDGHRNVLALTFEAAP